GDVALCQIADQLLILTEWALALDGEIFFTLIVADIDLLPSRIGKNQLAVSNHAGKMETHLLAQAEAIQRHREQQISGYTEHFCINVMQWVEIIGYFFSKSTSLLTGKSDFIAFGGKIIGQNHGLTMP
ncbi:MAG: hypothetical protein JAZ05_14000, partial [Candidatus Thiodiazotropha taylori]|nr:hypothetical protein [Candidatus Thiodiazotropha taylori]MCW4293127.1 hypothetical protein [Candidatus Thiodiazotropha taylori]